MTLVATELRDRLTAELAPLLAGFDRYALVDFPRHSNVGDSAIWLGARAALRNAGLRSVHECDYWTYRPDVLERASRDALIVINGGGNLGDLYAKHQALREDVLQRLPDRPVLQLPQTINFGDTAALDRARRVFASHRALTLLVRDSRSLELARQWFAAPSILAPDTAFALAGRLARRPAEQPILWLLRGDRETALDPADLPAGRADWQASDIRGPAISGTDRLVDILAPLARRAGAVPTGWLLGRAFDQRAATQVRHGLRLLSRGGVVVTDRLHGHILSLLVGIPHVLLDDRGGKVGSFHDTWTASPLVATAASIDEAREQAHALLAQARDQFAA